MPAKNRLHKEAVSPVLLELLQELSSVSEMNSFRLVGGTAIALQLGHRRSVDIDFFSNEKIDKTSLRQLLNKKFPGSQIALTQNNLSTEMRGVRVDIYDDWMIPFRNTPVIEEGIKIAALEDLAAFKLSAITARREKKDYIDLFFLFKKLGAAVILNDFKIYEPLLSPKSILFALAEVEVAQTNKSPMPDMLIEINWSEINESMTQAAKNYLAIVEEQRKSKNK